MIKKSITERYEDLGSRIRSLEYSWSEDRDRVQVRFSDNWIGEVRRQDGSFRSELNNPDAHTSTVPFALERKLAQLPNSVFYGNFIKVPQSGEGINFMMDYLRYMNESHFLDTMNGAGE